MKRLTKTMQRKSAFELSVDEFFLNLRIYFLKGEHQGAVEAIEGYERVVKDLPEAQQHDALNKALKIVREYVDKVQRKDNRKN